MWCEQDLRRLSWQEEGEVRKAMLRNGGLKEWMVPKLRLHVEEDGNFTVVVLAEAYSESPLSMPFRQVVGIAKRNPKDAADPQVGKFIALHRATHELCAAYTLRAKVEEYRREEFANERCAGEHERVLA